MSKHNLSNIRIFHGLPATALAVHAYHIEVWPSWRRKLLEHSRTKRKWTVRFLDEGPVATVSRLGVKGIILGSGGTMKYVEDAEWRTTIEDPHKNKNGNFHHNASISPFDSSTRGAEVDLDLDKRSTRNSAL